MCMKKENKSISGNMSLKNYSVYIVISILSLFLFGMILYRANADFMSDKYPSAITATIYKNDVIRDNPNVEMIAGVSRPIKEPTSEVHIANNGLMLLRGTRVISVDNSSNFNSIIRVIISWGSIDSIWEVNTNLSTELIKSDGKTGTMSDIEVGDIVTVTGNLVRNGPEPIISAVFIRK